MSMTIMVFLGLALYHAHHHHDIGMDLGVVGTSLVDALIAASIMWDVFTLLARGRKQ
jgi:hypothetical protein